MNNAENSQKRFRIVGLPQGMNSKDAVALIATWFGTGRVRPAPGTMGSLAAIPVGFAIQYFMGVYALALAAVLVTIIGAMAAERFSKASGDKDDSSIVIDEVAGMWIAAIPAQINLDLWIVAFVLFRIFDIYKPWPASFFDKRGKDGWDVMWDDVIAGFYAFLGTASAALVYMQMQ
jgi:phosphatidylglycerophosphatase A